MIGDRSSRGYVYIEVCDEGCRIAQAQLDQFFDPFFSTKDAGRGLGPRIRFPFRKRIGGCSASCRAGRRGLFQRIAGIGFRAASCKEKTNSQIQKQTKHNPVRR